MVRIGIVNIDTSHPKAFTDILHEGNRARVVAVYNDGFRGEDEVEAFVRSAGLEKRCQTVAELAGMVDVGFIQGCNWDAHLSYMEPFVRLGKSVFLDKPMVGNLRDVLRLRERVAAGAVVLGSSCMRYAPQIHDFLAVPVSQRGEIVSLHSTCGVDEFNYAIHAVEAIGGLVGTGAQACAYLGGGDIGGVRGESYSVRYKSGVIATYALTYGQWQKSVVSVLTSKQSYTLEPGGYEAMLERVVASVETGRVQTAPVEDILESIQIMLAGRISRQQGGGYVKLSDIPEDDPGFDGAAFAQGYADQAAKLYL